VGYQYHGLGRASIREGSVFFIEKKNQKTSPRWHARRMPSTRAMSESLFASFSSEKEESLPKNPCCA
jgi:hypothetical protein